VRRPRNLTVEERALWDLVARRARPLAAKPRGKQDPTDHAVPARPTLPTVDPLSPPMPLLAPPLPQFRIGQRADTARPHDMAPPVQDRLASAPVAMDAKAYGRLKRGKLAPEDRIDLHGMTMAEAHPQLLSFILTAHATGKRLVLVITGKGKNRDDGGPIPVRHGVLRHQVPHWLHMPPLSHVVLQVTAAHLRHGGHGAYYVYLRRSR